MRSRIEEQADGSFDLYDGLDEAVGRSAGGVLFDARGRVMLREPANHYGGYVWTFAKGRVDAGESDKQAALREVEEETGFTARIIGKIGSFRGDTSVTTFFLMEPIAKVGPPDTETARVAWFDPERAVERISLTRTPKGRERDLLVLQRALKLREKKLQPGLFARVIARVKELLGRTTEPAMTTESATRIVRLSEVLRQRDPDVEAVAAFLNERLGEPVFPLDVANGTGLRLTETLRVLTSLATSGPISFDPRTRRYTADEELLAESGPSEELLRQYLVPGKSIIIKNVWWTVRKRDMDAGTIVLKLSDFALKDGVKKQPDKSMSWKKLVGALQAGKYGIALEGKHYGPKQDRAKRAAVRSKAGRSKAPGTPSEAVQRFDSLSDFQDAARALPDAPHPGPDSAFARLHLGEFGDVDEASLQLWGYNRITGYWEPARAVTPETAPEWLKQWNANPEPKHSAYRVSKNRPSGRPKPSEEDAIKRDESIDESNKSAWAEWSGWTTDERIVFSATVGWKAGYGGDKDYRFNSASGATGITRAEWDAAVASLIRRGVFNKAGAVKPEWKRAYYALEPGAIRSVTQMTRGSGKSAFESIDEAKKPDLEAVRVWAMQLSARGQLTGGYRLYLDDTAFAVCPLSKPKMLALLRTAAGQKALGEAAGVTVKGYEKGEYRASGRGAFGRDKGGSRAQQYPPTLVFEKPPTRSYTRVEADAAWDAYFKGTETDEAVDEGLDPKSLRVGRFYEVMTSRTDTEPSHFLFVTGKQANGTAKGVVFATATYKASKASFNGYNLSLAREVDRRDVDAAAKSGIARKLDGKSFEDFVESVEDVDESFLPTKLLPLKGAVSRVARFTKRWTLEAIRSALASDRYVRFTPTDREIVQVIKALRGRKDGDAFVFEDELSESVDPAEVMRFHRAYQKAQQTKDAGAVPTMLARDLEPSDTLYRNGQFEVLSFKYATEGDRVLIGLRRYDNGEETQLSLPADEVVVAVAENLDEAAKPPAKMKAREINAELDRLDAEDSKIGAEFIAAGRGFERPSEVRKMLDPLAKRAMAVWDRKAELYAEVEARYGPGHNHRLPTHKRGAFGPRESVDEVQDPYDRGVTLSHDPGDLAHLQGYSNLLREIDKVISRMRPDTRKAHLAWTLARSTGSLPHEADQVLQKHGVRRGSAKDKTIFILALLSKAGALKETEEIDEALDPALLSKLRTLLIQSPGVWFELPQLVRETGAPAADVRQGLSRLVSQGTAQFERGKGYALAGQNVVVTAADRKARGARVMNPRTIDRSSRDYFGSRKRRNESVGDDVSVSDPFRAFGFEMGDDGKLHQIAVDVPTHACPKCTGTNAYKHEAHADTGYDEVVLRCPDCGKDSEIERSGV